MSGFLSSLSTEVGHRRRRMRAVFGDRGASVVNFSVLAGIGVGSLGLFVRPWMPGAAPWGFAVPVVYGLGYLLIEARRQQAVKRGADPAMIGPSYDWIVLIWSFACALAGVAAFVLAWGAEPPPPVDPDFWEPPEGTIDSTLGE